MCVSSMLQQLTDVLAVFGAFQDCAVGGQGVAVLSAHQAAVLAQSGTWLTSPSP